VIAPACYVVPAGELTSVLGTLVSLPFICLGAWFACRFLLDLPDYLYVLRARARRRRIRAIREARA